jgi:hypothetical protein
MEAIFTSNFEVDYLIAYSTNYDPTHFARSLFFSVVAGLGHGAELGYRPGQGHQSQASELRVLEAYHQFRLYCKRGDPGDAFCRGAYYK